MDPLEMLGQVFVAVLNMSLRGSWVILAVAAARPLLQRCRAPRTAIFALWAVAAFRLACPVSFTAAFSLLPAARPVPSDIARMARPAIDSGLSLVDNLVQPLLPVPSPAASANPLQIWLPLAGCVWLLGALALLGYSLLSLARLKARLRGALPLAWPAAVPRPTCATLWQRGGLPTAFVLGTIRPRVYLPAGLNEQQLTCILHHECAHLRRRDHLLKPLAFLLLCVHWFDPVVWLGFWLFGRDLELAADEAVLRTLGTAAKKTYCNVLLAVAAPAAPGARRPRFIGSPLAFGEGAVKGRVKNVLRYKKPVLWISLLVVLLLGALAIALLADPAAGRAAGLRLTFPAYQTGRDQYNAAIYDTAPFTVTLPLPAGWHAEPPQTPGGSPWTPLRLLDADDRQVGIIGFGIFEDVPDLPAEEFYKAAFAELRLGSLVSWCDAYTPVQTTDTYETAISNTLANESFLQQSAGTAADPAADENVASAAAAPTLAFPAVTLYDRERGVYVAACFAQGALSADQLTALAEGMTLTDG